MTTKIATLQTQLFIDGEFADAHDGGRFVTINPATGAQITRVSEAGVVDVDRAVATARKALEGDWGNISLPGRALLLRRMAQLIDEGRDDLARLESLDAGKPIRDCGAQIDIIVAWFDWFADMATKLRSHVVPGLAGHLNYTLRQPVGVVACITPWNYPLALYGIKVAPALAMGNAVILKPAEETPLTALALAGIAARAGIPAGAFTVLPGGPAVGEALVRHPRVRMVSFTGSTTTGKRIAAESAGTLKRVSLELGGKSPNLIFSDADLDVAVPTALFTFCVNQGQLCTAGTRLLVERRVHDEVVSRLTELAGRLRVGDPSHRDTQLGAVISEAQLRRIEGYVAEGRGTARLCFGGERPIIAGCERGYFYAPTVFDDVSPGAAIAQEEIFGPVLSVISFDDETEAVAIANNVAYGLAAGIWTGDHARAHRVASALDAGLVWINTMNVLSPGSPYSGRKDSGYGVEGGFEQCESLTQLKSVWANLTGAAPTL